MITQTIELKVLTEEKLIRVPMVQWDSGRVLQCTITDMQIPDEATAIFRAEKKSGVIYNTGIIDGDKIKIPITAQTLAEPGFLPCQIEIRNKEDVVKTFRFNIYVHSAIAEAGEESKPESTYFDKLIERAETAAENAEKSEAESGNYARIAENAARSAVESAQTAGENAQSAAESAKTAELSAQSATQSAESARQSDQSAAESKKQAAQSAQNAADSARSAEESQTQAAQSAQSAKQAAQSAAESQIQAEGSAKSAADSAESAGESQTQAMQNAESAKQDAQSAAESAESAKADANRAQEILDSIPDDYTEMHGKIEELQVEVGRKAPAIILTAEGEPPVIRGSADALIQDMELTGTTEQRQTTGKQLIPFPEIGEIIQGENLTCQIAKDGIIVNGTSQNAYQSFILFENVNLEAGTYTEYINKEKGLFINFSPAGYVGNQHTFTLESQTTGNIYIGTTNAQENFNNYLLKAMINEGETVLPWESYTGGKPSPSPEYKQDVINVQSPVQVEVMGGNLLDIVSRETNTIGVEIDYNIITVITRIDSDSIYNRMAYSDFELDPGTYYISAEFYDYNFTENGNRCELKKSKTNKTIVYISEKASYKTFTITEKTSLYFAIYSGYKTKNSTYKIKNLMISKCDSIKWEPYKQPQTVTITSDRPITKWDKLIKQDGVWGWLYKSNEVEFDGSDDEKWNYTQGSNPSQFFISVPDIKNNVGANVFCDKFKGYAGNAEWCCRVGGSYNILTPIDIASSVDDIKTWLQSNPIKVLYETENTEFVPLPQEQQDQLNALCTYGPTTVIITDPQMGTKIDYVADTRTYIDSKFAEIAMQLVEAISEK